MRKITDEQLLAMYGATFIKLRSSGKTNIECAKIIGIGKRSVGRLRKLLGKYPSHLHHIVVIIQD